MSGVQIRVRSDSRQARSDLKKLENSVGRIESAASSMTSAFKTAAVSLGTLFVSGNLTKGLVSAGDTLKSLENRVALVSGRGKELGVTLNRLYGISAKSRTSIGNTVEIFNRFSLALRGTNKTQDQILAVTQAVGKAAVLSGASAESARAAIIQLGQGLAAGQLRGEELNSVLEQTPRVAQAIADGLGVPFGKLKELAQDGQITSEAVFNAIIAKAQEIEDEFALIEPTVRDLSVVMRDEFTRALGAINDITGLSQSAADKIVLLTQAFRFVADNALFYFTDIKIYLLEFLIDVIKTYAKIKDAGSNLFSSDFDLKSFQESMGQIKLGIQDAVVGLTDPLVVQFQDIKLADAFPSLQSVEDRILAFRDAVVNFFKNIYDAVVGNSWWGEIFWEGSNRIGGSKFTEALNNVKTTLESWTGSLKTFFSDLYVTVVDLWGKTTQALTTKPIETPGGLEGSDTNAFGKLLEVSLEKVKAIAQFFKTAGENVAYFTTQTALATVEARTFDSATNFFTSKTDAIKSFTETLTKDYGESGGFLGYMTKLMEAIREFTGGAFKQSVEDLEEFFMGPVQEIQGNNPNSESERGRGKSGLAKIIDNSSEFIADNKFALIGTAIASAIVVALPSELRNNLLAGAFFVLGAAIGQGLMDFITKFGPVIAIVGALKFGPDILNSEEFQNSLAKIGEFIGNFLSSLFSGEGGDGGATDYVTRVVEGLKESFTKFGEGLAKGLFGEAFRDEANNALGGAIAALSIVAILSGSARKLLFRLGGAIAANIFGPLFVSNSEKSLNTALGKLKTRGATAVTLSIAIEFAPIKEGLQALGMDEEASKILEDGITNVGQGALIGGTIGSFIPVFGTLIGAAIGAAIGGIVSLVQYRQLFDDFGKSIENAAKDAWTVFTSSITDIGATIKDSLVTAFDESVAYLKEKIGNVFNIFGASEQRAAAVIEDSTYSKAGGVAAASGGYISGPGGSRDDLIPAMLSNGEFVIQASAVRKFGRGFLSAINQGTLRGFKDGSPPDPRYLTLLGRQEQYKNKISETSANLNAMDRGALADDGTENSIRKVKEAAERALTLVESQLGLFDDNGHLIVTETDAALLGLGDPTLKGGKGSKAFSDGQDFANSFKQDFANGLSEALKTGDFKSFFTGVIDSFTSKYIDAVVTGFTDSLFDAVIGTEGSEGPFGSLFTNAMNFGEKLTGGTGDAIAKGLTKATDELKGGSAGKTGFLGNLFSGISNMFTKDGFFGNLFGSITGMFGGGAGNAGTIFSLFSGGSFFGFNSGGIVPHTPYSQRGVDSVPAMLTPGELVIPTDQINNMMGSNNQTVVNLSITGDVSRQTRQEVIKMLPTIASGVNAQNKERNFKYG